MDQIFFSELEHENMNSIHVTTVVSSLLLTLIYQCTAYYDCFLMSHPFTKSRINLYWIHLQSFYRYIDALISTQECNVNGSFVYNICTNFISCYTIDKQCTVSMTICSA